MFSRPNLALSTLKNFMGLHYTGHPYNEPQNQTHQALCALGANWLVRNHKCNAVLVERGCCLPEMPDVIGFYGSASFVIEAKISRGDFLADGKKSFRADPTLGMGEYRYFICPKSLISAAEVPEGWGLLYVSEKGIIKKIKEATRLKEFNRHAEFMMLTSALATPWKLFQHWNDDALERLFRIKWMDTKTEVDMKLFSTRLMANRILSQEGIEE